VVNAQTEETQETALTLACCGGFLEIAELLINSDANLELGCSTPLMEAAQEGHVDLVKYLIASGLLSSYTFTFFFCSMQLGFLAISVDNCQIGTDVSEKNLALC